SIVGHRRTVTREPGSSARSDGIPKELVSANHGTTLARKTNVREAFPVPSPRGHLTALAQAFDRPLPRLSKQSRRTSWRLDSIRLPRWRFSRRELRVQHRLVCLSDCNKRNRE